MICRSLVKAILFAVSLAVASNATSVTYDFYTHYENPTYGINTDYLFAEFTAPDFLFNVPPPAGRVAEGSYQTAPLLFAEDMAYCAGCGRVLFGGEFVFQGLRIMDNYINASYLDYGGTGYQSIYYLGGVPASAFSELGTHSNPNGIGGTFFSVQELGKAVTYAPEPSTCALVGSALLAAMLRLRRRANL